MEKENLLKDLTINKEISVEDKKLIKEYKKAFKVLDKLINKVQNSKIYNDGQKRHFLGKYLFGARGHCVNRIRIIEDKYIKQKETET